MSRLSLLSMIVAWFVGSMAAHSATTTESPTHDERAILELHNAHRREPGVVELDMIDLIRMGKMPGDITFLNHGFQKIKPLSPVVFNAQLNAAAHAILSAGKKPEHGAAYEVLPAMSAAGYAPTKSGLALVALDFPNPTVGYYSAITWIVRVVHIKKKDVAVLARKDALMPNWREAGVAVATSKDTSSVVIVLGTGSAKRYVGGVVYRDNDRDFSCDPDEGEAGVVVRAGKVSTTTGPSGAWWLALDSQEAVDVTFTKGDSSVIRPLAKGEDNALIDWRLPIPGDFKAADQLIAACEAAIGKEDKQRGALAALYFGTRGLCLDGPRLDTIDRLVGPMRDNFDSLISDVQGAMSDEPKEWKTKLSEFEKPWKGSLAAWFKEADDTYKQRQQWKTVLAAPEEERAKLAKPLLNPLKRKIADTSDPTFAAKMREWLKDLEKLSPIPDPTPRRK